MRQYLPYMMWVSRLGLLATSLFFIDYFLPYRELEERGLLLAVVEASVRFRSPGGPASSTSTRGCW